MNKFKTPKIAKLKLPYIKKTIIFKPFIIIPWSNLSIKFLIF